MADEPNLDANIQMAEAEPVATPMETKKARAPARPKEAKALIAKNFAKQTPAATISKSRRHSQSEKAEKLAQIERRLNDGATLKAAAQEAGISDQTFYQWKRSAPASGANVAKPTSHEHSVTDLSELEAENLRLRGLLAEKLRAENTELRKRLGTG